ncbi:hypothetical protein FLONG3_6773 [Fusarium longipes]|uniref:Uncharacterized protein n=1 Tax=Fusarium longipes TaxID=694270 RepID=A0A395SJU6_9HYPO|nr:hypothetical protein FLONG3_6773 [Fusarium longipes]
MSNNSLPDLTAMISKNCDPHTLSDRFPFFDVPTAWVPMNNDSYGGMSEVCSPNPVNLYNCALWCELPEAFMDGYEASGRDDFDLYFRDQLRDTGMNMSNVGIFSAMEDNAAPVTRRPPSIMALGTLALAAFVALSI